MMRVLLIDRTDNTAQAVNVIYACYDSNLFDADVSNNFEPDGEGPKEGMYLKAADGDDLMVMMPKTTCDKLVKTLALTGIVDLSEFEFEWDKETKNEEEQ